MSKPMTVARYAKEHRGWFYGCLLLFALVAFFCLKAIYDMTVYGAKAPLYAFTAIRLHRRYGRFRSDGSGIAAGLLFS